ncbi:glycosyltransferase family 25 protein [Nitratireductor alexandrii]|uniref:glycosyltransferase family 25 protein n=1 Tax=Nitratireductor alexandrii TaxID=2448161 RepID=UPI000FD8E38E|nr:glycosyltransferase family 25 protein [Nitratireductor alexandrii]
MVPVLVINLARSPERWDAIRQTATGLDLRRVEGVDGGAIAREEWSAIDRERFRARHGRIVTPGEYGCYRSHLAALATVVAEGVDVAVIAEDDIVLNDRLGERAAALFAGVEEPRLVKLVNHRTTGFLEKGVTAAGDAYGRCLFGPLGSAACYAVNRSGAQRLVETLATMWLPWDVALERGWATGVATYTTREPLVAFSTHRARSTITASYAHTKLPTLQRRRAFSFRARDFLRRAGYALEAA